MRAKWWVGTIISLCMFAGVLSAAEWLLTGAGYPTAPISGNSHFDIGSVYGWAQTDPDTGWKNKEGTSVSMEPGNVNMTFWSHGRRATRARPELNPKLPTAIILGDSISQGYGIIDAETYGYIVQTEHPEWNVENLSTGGYGGYQSLLMLRKVYQEKFLQPKLVVYAFAGFHANRDVANFPWVEGFINNKGEWFAPPNVIARDGKLLESPLTVYPAWPWEHDSRLVRVLKKGYLKFIYGQREKYENDVTKLEISEMRRLSEANGAKFLVLRLIPGTNDVDKYLGDSKASVVDCVVDVTSPPTKVGGVGHPSGMVHAQWAQCLSKWMSDNPEKK
jgi:hypothetical protein